MHGNHAPHLLEETVQAPPGPGTLFINVADDTHAGCTVCMLGIEYQEDMDGQYLHITLVEGAEPPEALEATVRVTVAADAEHAEGEAHSYRPAPGTIELLATERLSCWSFPVETSRILSLSVDFTYRKDGQTCVHESISVFRRATRAAPSEAAE
jgi:hypothetical protein